MDGTLSTGRSRGWRPLATLLVLAAAGGLGCSTFKGTTAASYLLKIRKDPDPNARFLAYEQLASPRCYDNEDQKAEAVKALISKLDGAQEPVATRAVICRTLGELRDPSAREAILKATSDPEGFVRVQACRALGKVGRAEDATVLARIMAVDSLEDCKVASIEGMAELQAIDPRIFEVLINGMDHDDPAIRLASLQALRKITGKDLGVEPGPWRQALTPTPTPPQPETASSATPGARK